LISTYYKVGIKNVSSQAFWNFLLLDPIPNYDSLKDLFVLEYKNGPLDSFITHILNISHRTTWKKL